LIISLSAKLDETDPLGVNSEVSNCNRGVPANLLAAGNLARVVERDARTADYALHSLVAK